MRMCGNVRFMIQLMLCAQVPFLKNCGADDICTSDIDLTVTVIDLHKCVIILLIVVVSGGVVVVVVD